MAVPTARAERLGIDNIKHLDTIGLTPDYLLFAERVVVFTKWLYRPLMQDPDTRGDASTLYHSLERCVCAPGNETLRLV